MDFYDEMAATVTELLDEFGRPLVLRRKSEASYDPATGQTTGGGLLELDTIGLFRTITAEYAMANQVLSGDRMVILGPAQEPMATDRLLAGTEVLTIVKIETVKPADTALAYRLQVRG